VGDMTSTSVPEDGGGRLDGVGGGTTACIDGGVS